LSPAGWIDEGRRRGWAARSPTRYNYRVSYVLAVTAAFVAALTSVLQRIGVESAPASAAMRLSLMAHAVRRKIWLVGFALMLVLFGLQATALRLGQLSVVQPVLTTELLFLLLILAVWFRYHLGWREWAGSVAIVAGLGGFFLAAHPSGGNLNPDNRQWIVASALLIVGITGFILAGLRGPRWWRAAAFGTATAITAAFSAALTKSTTIFVSRGWGHVFTHAQPYLLAVTGIGTVFLIQNALHAGPITASRTTMVTVNPLVSILIGINLFGDRLRGGLLRTVVECIALAVLITGVVVLSQTKLVVGEIGADGAGELLATARQRGSQPVVIISEADIAPEL
jgi:drug/metabolite transporter (DMT)-like permease